MTASRFSAQKEKLKRHPLCAAAIPDRAGNLRTPKIQNDRQRFSLQICVIAQGRCLTVSESLAYRTLLTILYARRRMGGMSYYAATSSAVQV